MWLIFIVFFFLIDNPEKTVFSLLGEDLNVTILDIIVDVTEWKVAVLY